MLRELATKKRIMRKDRKNSRHLLLYGALFSFILFFISVAKPSLTDFLHNRVYDAFLSTNTGQPSSTPVIIDIDEKSLRQYGQWPWPRYRVAILLDQLRNLGALSIGMDMMFAEEDRTSIEMVGKELSQDFGIQLGFKEIPHDLRNSDRRLADSLTKGNIVLGYQFLFEEGPDSKDCLLHALTVNRLGQVREEKNLGLFVKASGVSCNLKMLAQAAGASGFFNVLPDLDGILRRVPLVIKHQDRYYPSLALATLMQSLGVKDVLLKTEDGAQSLCLNKTAIPLTSGGSLLIRFRGKNKTFPYISAADVLSGHVPKEKVENKIVFVGTSASGMKELRSTPLDPVFPGVEIHATVVDNILHQDFISRPKWASGFESLLALGLGLLSTVVLAWTGAGWSSLLLGGIGACVWQISAWTFQTKGIFISPVLSLIALVFNFSLLIFLKYWQEEKRVRERTRELAMVQEATIESLSSLTETRDPDTGGHIKRTQNYVSLLAESLKVRPKFSSFLDDDETIDLLCKSAPLHDIGKVGVSDKILLKPGKLDEKEFEEMKKHTTYGRDAILAAERKLGKTSFLRFARDIAYTHHERWDGLGYPEGLRGDEIPISGRLMALADAYDAITSERVYKSQLPHNTAVEIIAEAKGLQFDPDVVDAFLEVKEDFRKVALKYADP